jgi:hypothetical protein
LAQTIDTAYATLPMMVSSAAKAGGVANGRKRRLEMEPM